jgi:hypothetical protein
MRQQDADDLVGDRDGDWPPITDLNTNRTCQSVVRCPVCTENPVRVDDVTESSKLAE